MIKILALFDSIVPVLSGVLAGGVGYILARKKNEADLRKLKVETDFLEINNFKSAVIFWKEQHDELKVELRALKDQVGEFVGENQELKKEIALFREENILLSVQIDDFKKQMIAIQQKV